MGLAHSRGMPSADRVHGRRGAAGLDAAQRVQLAGPVLGCLCCVVHAGCGAPPTPPPARLPIFCAAAGGGAPMVGAVCSGKWMISDPPPNLLITSRCLLSAAGPALLMAAGQSSMKRCPSSKPHLIVCPSQVSQGMLPYEASRSKGAVSSDPICPDPHVSGDLLRTRAAAHMPCSTTAKPCAAGGWMRQAPLGSTGSVVCAALPAPLACIPCCCALAALGPPGLHRQAPADCGKGR